MPHQCLKCGAVYADGSPEILRGCGDCKGTRFFYTDEPISEEKRQRLRETASEDMRYVIQEMLTGGSSLLDDEVLSREDWVRIARTELEKVKAGSVQSGPSTGENTPSGTGHVVASVPLPGPEAIDGTKGVEGGGRPDQHREPEKPAMTSKKRRLGTTPSGEALKSVKSLKMPKSRGRHKKKKGEAAGVPEETPQKLTRADNVNVIQIEEEGVFNIDLEGLLNDSPIIIQKDGSYLVHLPSVFEKGAKRD